MVRCGGRTTHLVITIIAALGTTDTPCGRGPRANRVYPLKAAVGVSRSKSARAGILVVDDVGAGGQDGSLREGIANRHGRMRRGG
jgi:hypothetical protein